MSRDRLDSGTRAPSDRGSFEAEGRAGTAAGAPGSAAGQAADGNGFGIRVSQREGRLMLEDVDANSPLGRAGLRVDDEIIAVNGRRVSTQADVGEQLRVAAEQGEPLALAVFRNDRLRVVEAGMQSGPSQDVPPAPPSQFGGAPLRPLQQPGPPAFPPGERIERSYRGAIQQPIQKGMRPGQEPFPPDGAPAAVQRSGAVQKGDYYPSSAANRRFRRARY